MKKRHVRSAVLQMDFRGFLIALAEKTRGEKRVAQTCCHDLSWHRLFRSLAMNAVGFDEPDYQKQETYGNE